MSDTVTNAPLPVTPNTVATTKSTLPTALVVGLCVLLFLVLQFMIRISLVNGHYHMIANNNVEKRMSVVVRDIQDPDGKYLKVFVAADKEKDKDEQALLTFAKELNWGNFETVTNNNNYKIYVVTHSGWWGWNLAYLRSSQRTYAVLKRLQNLEVPPTKEEFQQVLVTINYINGDLTGHTGDDKMVLRLKKVYDVNNPPEFEILEEKTVTEEKKAPAASS